jgi:hypothetical protein
VTEANAALLVADDDERCETEATAALDDLGDAVDVDELVDEFAIALFAILTSSRATSFPVPLSFSFFFSGCNRRFKTRPRSIFWESYQGPVG